MVPQIGLQCGMVLHEFLVIHQRRILAQLLGGFAVSVQELIEARQFFAVGAIAIVLAVIVAIFLPHEGVRIFLYLLANCRMLLQIGLKLRMVSDVFLVIHEGRIFAKLLGSFAVTHRETAEQLRKDPSLVDNQEYVRNHPELQAYLQEHPAIREEIKENPNAFMRQEYRYDHREDDRDRTNREELARFDQFLDTHRETAQQLRKDPSLMDNEEFVKNHPALQSYLRDHPELRAQLKQDPNAFLHQEERYDRREDDRGINRGEVARFNQFL